MFHSLGVRNVIRPSVLSKTAYSAPILSRPDFGKPFTLQTDASAYTLGAVLAHEVDGEERVVCFLSRSLTKQQQNYSTNQFSTIKTKL